jgi:hypothetical protein
MDILIKNAQEFHVDTTYVEESLDFLKYFARSHLILPLMNQFPIKIC